MAELSSIEIDVLDDEGNTENVLGEEIVSSENTVAAGVHHFPIQREQSEAQHAHAPQVPMNTMAPIYQQVGPYQVRTYHEKKEEYILGTGSFGKVLKAYKDNLKLYAAKRIDLHELQENQVKISESELLPDTKDLHHKNVMSILYHETITNYLFIIMEYCEFTLDKYLHVENPDPQKRIAVINDTFEGVEYLHSKSLAHRDLKPNNVMVHEGVVKITDFSYAKDLGDGTTSCMNTVRGNPHFMAPELLDRHGHRSKDPNIQFDRSIDIWSLGMIAAYTCMDRPGQKKIWDFVFGGLQNESNMVNIVEVYFKQHWISHELDTIMELVHKMTSFHPTNRPRNPTSTLQHLLASARNEPLPQINDNTLDAIHPSLPPNSSTQESSIAPSSSTPTVSSMLLQLGLEKHYPNKISLSDVMKVQRNKVQNSLHYEDLPWNMLTRILMMNHKGRDDYNICENDNSSGSINMEDDDDDGSGIFDAGSLGSEGDNSVHPLDVFLTTFVCCDPFLQQRLTVKMLQCCLAVPLVAGIDERLICMTWPLQSSAIEWKVAKDDAREVTLMKHAMHMVSFLKVGECTFSKSDLLNAAISNQPHNTFCNKDCSNASGPYKVAKGMVEIFPYLPGARDSDPFEEEILFINLRGDACKLNKQKILLESISTAIVVVCDVEEYHTVEDQISEQSIVFVYSSSITPSEVSLKVMKEISKTRKNAILSLKAIKGTRKYRQRTTNEIRDQIQKQIKLILNASLEKKSLAQQVQMVSDLLIDIDEKELQGCMPAKETASALVTECIMTPIADYKQEMLPLQGTLWERWGKLEKDKFRAKEKEGMNLETIKSEIDQEMRVIRQHQDDIVQQIKDSHVMSRFRNLLLQDTLTELDLAYLMTCIRIELDAKSREILPKLRKAYGELTLRYLNSNICEEESVQMKQRMDQIGEKIIKSSFGLEHLLRELGQIYEAKFYTSSNIPSQIEELAGIAAQALLLGVPLEILDGDAGCVPLRWVQAVLLSLQKQVENKKLFVLSVVGLQSSGKSTLLNAMFGLDFAVSAGRCTRGIYAQLLEIDKSKIDLPFDFMLVLDSEGLRAPERKEHMQQYDNELATLVIGLADMTLVNLKGESATDMKDILQISVHALLRMKLANNTKKQRCFFVHQNVNVIDENKLMQQILILKESLDNSTALAAEEEKRVDIKHFSEVIEFRGKGDVCYFSDFFSGTPPMAPINPGYSDNVNDLKAKLIDRLIQENPQILTINDFICRLEDVWEAILSDDFVFCFQNTVAIKAHLELERLHSKVKFETEQKIFDVKTKVTSKIAKCNNHDDLNNFAQEASNEFLSTAEIYKQDALSKVRDYFETTSYKEILKSLRYDKMKMLTSSIDLLTSEMEKEMKILKEQREEAMKKTSRTKQHEEELLETAIKMVNTLRGTQISDSELNRKFDDMWMKIADPPPDVVTTDLVRDKMEFVLFKYLHDKGCLSVEPLLPFLRGKANTSDNFGKLIGPKDIKKTYIKDKSNDRKVWQKKLTVHRNIERDVADLINYRVIAICNHAIELYSVDSESGFYASCGQIVEDALRLFDELDEQLCNDSDYSYTISTSCKSELTAHIVYCATSKFNVHYMKDQVLVNVPARKVIGNKLEKMLLDTFKDGNFHHLNLHLTSFSCEYSPQPMDLAGTITAKNISKDDLCIAEWRDYAIKDSENAAKKMNFLLKNVDAKIKDTCTDDSKFENIHGSKVVNAMIHEIDDFNIYNSDKFTFTWHCKAKFAVKVAKHAITKFEVMNIINDVKYSGRSLIEHHRQEMKAFVIGQIKANEMETAKELFFSIIKPDICERIKQLVGNKITGDLIGRIGFSKYDLIVCILTSLAEKNDFHDFMSYLQDAHTYALKWICTERDHIAFRTKDSSKDSNFISLTTVEINKLMECLKLSIEAATRSTKSESDPSKRLQRWCETFYSSIRGEITLAKEDFKTFKYLMLTDFDGLQTCLLQYMDEFSTRLKKMFVLMNNEKCCWGMDYIPNRLMDTLWGCKQQCYFCGEPCRKTDAKHTDRHECLQHRPNGIMGVHWEKTDTLSTLVCSSAVANSTETFNCTNPKCPVDKPKKGAKKHLFMEYDKCLPSLYIKPDKSGGASKYWKWFMSSHKDDLVKYYKVKSAGLPDEWKKITKREAIDSLKLYRTMQTGQTSHATVSIPLD